MVAVSTNTPHAQVTVSFDAAVPAEERQHLLEDLTSREVPVRRGMDIGFRTVPAEQAEVVTVAVLTMLSTGFVQRVGEQAADRTAKVFTIARDWLRRRTPAGSTVTEVEILDEATGIEIRVTTSDPDQAGRLLRDAITAAHRLRRNQPLRWDQGWGVPAAPPHESAAARKDPA
jgi:hypothetical protein